MKIVTDRDQEILDFIQIFSAMNGYSPSMREIGEAVFMSRSAVQRHLYKLVELGYVTITPKTPRSIVVNIAV